MFEWKVHDKVSLFSTSLFQYNSSHIYVVLRLDA